MTVVHKGGWVRALRAHWLVAAILLAGLASSLIDTESGLRKWYSIRGELDVTRERMASLNEKAAVLETEIRALEADPFAVERAIREELDRALPGEIVVRFGSFTTPD